MKINSIIMPFTLSTCLKEAITLHPRDLNNQSSQVYLELLLKKDDIDQFMKLTRENYDNGHLKSMYGVRPEEADLEFCLDQANFKIQQNRYYDLLDDECDDLYYVIKLKSQSDQSPDQIVGGIEIYGDQHCAEIGVLVDYRQTKKKYGLQATKIAIEFIKENIKAKTIKWECDSDNLGSLGIAYKCGFIKYKEGLLYEGRPETALYLGDKPPVSPPASPRTPVSPRSPLSLSYYPVSPCSPESPLKASLSGAENDPELKTVVEAFAQMKLNDPLLEEL